MKGWDSIAKIGNQKVWKLLRKTLEKLRKIVQKSVLAQGVRYIQTAGLKNIDPIYDKAHYTKNDCKKFARSFVNTGPVL